MSKAILTAILALLVLFPAIAAEPSAKALLKLAKDGFPTGSATPEGAACDHMRAFIGDDSSLFLRTSVKPYGTAETKKAYQEHLATMVTFLREEAKSKPSRGHPVSIEKCFAARHLAASGPVSYGSATFGFQDIMFVDVEMGQYGGKTNVERTLVIKDKQGKWAVHPAPDLSPLLSVGFHDEADSEKDFSEAYSTK